MGMLWSLGKQYLSQKEKVPVLMLFLPNLGSPNNYPTASLEIYLGSVEQGLQRAMG